MFLIMLPNCEGLAEAGNCRELAEAVNYSRLAERGVNYGGVEERATPYVRVVARAANSPLRMYNVSFAALAWTVAYAHRMLGRGLYRQEDLHEHLTGHR